MKFIIAYIRPEKLNDVKKELYAREVWRISATNSLGHSDEPTPEEVYRGVKEEVGLVKKIRLEIAVNDDFVQKTVDAIVIGGQTGKSGDGKIFILPLEECVSIQNGEQGGKAIG